MTDYIPSQDAALISWEQNLAGTIDTYSATLGLSAGEVTDIKTLCGNIGTAIAANVAAKSAALSAQTSKNSIVGTSVRGLRTHAQSIKTKTNYTATIGEALGIEGAEGAPFDADNYKPVISGKSFPGHVTITFTKKGVEGVNVYERLKGEKTWVKLSFDSHSPYVDNRPLATPGAAETREYMAIGVLDDAEIGQMSDIVEVVFGG